MFCKFSLTTFNYLCYYLFVVNNNFSELFLEFFSDFFEEVNFDVCNSDME